MALARRLRIAPLLASSVLVAPAAAGADEPPPPTGIEVRVDGVRPNTSVQIERDYYAPALLQCFDACSTVLEPGRYRLRVLSSSRETVGTQDVNIERPVVFHATSANPAAAPVGLVLGIGGIVLLVSSMAALTSSLLMDGCDGSSPCAAGPLAAYGLVALVGGAILTPVGWSMFARNRRLFQAENVKERDAGAIPGFSFGVVPSAGGASGIVTLRF